MRGFDQGVAVAAGDVGVVLVGVYVEEIWSDIVGHGFALDDVW